MSHTTSGQSVTLGQLALMVWRYRLVSVPVGLAVAGWLMAMAFQAVPVYESKATCSLTLNRQGSEVGLDRQEADSRPDIMMFNTQRDQIISVPVLTDAVMRGNLTSHEPYTSADDPVKVLTSRLQVSMSKDSYLLEVRLRDEDPTRSERNLQAVIDAFIDWQTREQQESIKRAVAFLSNEIASARERLDAAQAAVQHFRSTSKILSSEEVDNLASVRLRSWNEQRTSMLGRLSSGDALIAQLDTIDASTVNQPQTVRIARFLESEAIANNPLILETQKSISELEASRVELLLRYLPRHPRVIEVLKRIAAKRQNLLDQIGQTRKGIVTAQLQMKTELDTLGKRISEDEMALATFRDDAIRLRDLEQESRLQSDLLTNLTSQLNEKTVQARMQGGTLSLLNPPRVGRFPVSLSKKISIVVAIAAGLLATIIAGLIAGLFDKRVRSPESVTELTGLPLLARIPQMDTVTAIDRAVTEADVAFSEAFRSLRTTLRMLRRKKGCHVLVVTSCSPAEGKSTVSANLALSLVSMGARVLLIDGDLRRPRLHRILDDDNTNGLTDVLTGRVPRPSRLTRHTLVFPDGAAPIPSPPPGPTAQPPAVQIVNDEAFFITDDLAANNAEESQRDPLTGLIANKAGTAGDPLHFIPAGARVDNPAELLAGASFAHSIANWRRQYDYMIIDTAPVGMVSDALVVAQHADSILLVVTDRVTDRRLLQKVVASLVPLPAAPCGFVYNRDPNARSEYGQSYGGYYSIQPSAFPAHPAPSATPPSAP